MNRAYLLTDAQLEDALEAENYDGACHLEIGLDGFVLVEKENNTTLSDGHVVRGVSDFPAHAARISFKKLEGFHGDVTETIFDGSLHLGYFIDRRLVWAGKNIAICDYGPETFTRNRVYVENPRFLASGIIDRRKK